MFSEMTKNNAMIVSGVFLKIKKQKLTCFLLTLLQTLSQLESEESSCKNIAMMAIFNDTKLAFKEMALGCKKVKLGLASKVFNMRLDSVNVRKEMDQVEKGIT